MNCPHIGGSQPGAWLNHTEVPSLAVLKQLVTVPSV